MNYLKKKKIRNFILENRLKIREIKPVPGLGGFNLFTIRYEKIRRKWDIQFDSSIIDDGTDITFIMMALASILRREKPWFKGPDYKIFSKHLEVSSSNFPFPKEKLDDKTYAVFHGFYSMFELELLYKQNHINNEEVERVLFHESIPLEDRGFVEWISLYAIYVKNGGDLKKIFSQVSKKEITIISIIRIFNEALERKEFSFGHIHEVLRILFEPLRIDSVYDLFNALLQSEKKLEDYKYHVAISFAGEDRAIAKKIAESLRNLNYQVFFDEFEKSSIWGKDLYEYLTQVYSKEARYCLMIISNAYATKLWTKHERKAAQARAFQENKTYILPLIIDKTQIPGILDTTAYIDYHTIPFSDLISLIIKKISE